MRLRRLGWLVLALPIGYPAAAAEGGRPDLRAVLSAPFASELTAAPAGGLVAWLLKQEGARNVWVAAPPGYAPRRLTAYLDDDGQEITILTWTPDAKSRRVDLDKLSKEEVASWKAGERLLLSGKLLTGRDAAHKRIEDLIKDNKPLPVDFTNRAIYYVGPVDPVRDEVVGPAGPTTSTRMDKFTETMLGRAGLIAMVGKAERGPAAIESIRKHRAAYLMAVGGAAYLVAKAIRKSRVLAFEDLGMEAIYEFEVRDMPVTVAVDANGTSVHSTGPAEWSKKIIELKLPVAAA